MGVFRLRRHVPFALVLVAVPLFTACGDDEPTTLTPETIEGSWTLVSLTAPSQPQWGDAVTDDGLSMSVLFSSAGNYFIAVSNDWPSDPWICDGTSSCAWQGAYSINGNTLVFDPATSDETSASYTLSGDRVTLTFTDMTDPYRMVFERDQ